MLARNPLGQKTRFEINLLEGDLWSPYSSQRSSLSQKEQTAALKHQYCSVETCTAVQLNHANESISTKFSTVII